MGFNCLKLFCRSFKCLVSSSKFFFPLNQHSCGRVNTTSYQSIRAYSLNDYPQWDENWDKLNDLKLAPEAVRHYILVRTGQNEEKESTSRKVTSLSEKGKNQAKITGERLNKIIARFDGAVASSSVCCLETASIIIQQHKSKIEPLKNALLKEVPLPADPPIPDRIIQDRSVFRGLPLLEAAFRSLFYRPMNEDNTHHLFVADENAIRYCVCRALQFPVDHWVRFSLKHCSVTALAIRGDGRVYLRSMGEVAHLPQDLQTS